MRTVYTRDGVRMVRDLLTGEEWELAHFLSKRYLAGKELWAEPTPVGPPCDGVERWAYRPDDMTWVKGSLFVRHCHQHDDYVWDCPIPRDGFHGTVGASPTLHAAKRAAERSAGGE